MKADQLTESQRRNLGRNVKKSYGNPLIQSFAAELIGESYPLSEAQTEIVLKDKDLTTLGYKFAKWVDDNPPEIV